MLTYNHNSQQQDRVIVQEIQLAFSTHVKSKYPYYVGEGGELLPRAWQRHYLVILLVVLLLFCLLSFATPPPTSLHKLLFHTLGSQQGCQNMFHSKWAEATFLFRKSGSEQAPFPPWLWYPCDMYPELGCSSFSMEMLPQQDTFDWLVISEFPSSLIHRKQRTLRITKA